MLKQLLALIGLTLSLGANAATLSFDFTGTVSVDELGYLFPAKAVGDSFSGSFTVDTGAALISGDGVIYGNYDSSNFNVTLDGTEYAVDRFSVWKTGVEFSWYAPDAEGYLSLRSLNDIYTDASVPTDYQISSFDSLASINAASFSEGFRFEDGEITSISPSAVPIPAAAWLFGSALMGLMGVARRKNV